MKPQQVIYQHSKDRYFDNLVGFIVNAASLATCFEAEEYGKANRFDATHYISIIGNPKVSGLEIRFYPHLTLQTLIKNQWPTTISIEKLSINLNPPAHPIFLTTLKKIHSVMIINAFIQYYEANKSLVFEKFTNQSNWPMIWKFAKVIRDALTHNGAIRIDIKKMGKVHWKTLSYDFTNNEKVIFYNDITAVELILLMEEMDKAI